MLRTCFVLFLSILVASCTQQGTGRQVSPFDNYIDTMSTQPDNTQTVMVDQKNVQQQTSTLSQGANGKIAILLPLTGAQSAIGQSMLNAAQMALFDINDNGFELLTFDTKGTTNGATESVNQAAAEGAKLIIGPLLADNVRAAGMAAGRYNLQVIGFTTDSSVIGGNVMTLGILPFDQGKRMAQYASKAGLNRVAIITTNNSYARSVISAFEAEATRQNITITDKLALRTQNDSARTVQILKANEANYDAIFMPIGDPQLSVITRALAEQNLSPTTKPWLGAGLWDDAAIRTNPYISGAKYTAPSSNQRNAFERQYKSVYGQSSHRLASLAYDATALSAILLKQNNQTISRQSVMNPNGFAGTDGIFRFLSNGAPERGLAIHQIGSGGRTTIIDRAPSSFQSQVGMR